MSNKYIEFYFEKEIKKNKQLDKENFLNNL